MLRWIGYCDVTIFCFLDILFWTPCSVQPLSLLYLMCFGLSLLEYESFWKRCCTAFYFAQILQAHFVTFLEDKILGTTLDFSAIYLSNLELFRVVLKGMTKNIFLALLVIYFTPKQFLVPLNDIQPLFGKLDSLFS